MVVQERRNGEGPATTEVAAREIAHCVGPRSPIHLLNVTIRPLQSISQTCSSGYLTSAKSQHWSGNTCQWQRLALLAWEKGASVLGLGGGFSRILRLLHQLQLASHELAAIWQNSKFQIQQNVDIGPVVSYWHLTFQKNKVKAQTNQKGLPDSRVGYRIATDCSQSLITVLVRNPIRACGKVARDCTWG